MYCNMKKISFIMIFTITICLVYAQFAGGKGTEVEPYLIETAEQLDSIRAYIGEEFEDIHFRQIADIDLSEYENWQPIGDDIDSFSGVYDGANFRISGLVSDQEDRYIGLFGYVKYGRLENIVLIDVEVRGLYAVGGLVGYLRYSKAVNCHVSGTVAAPGAVGGLIGYCRDSEVSHSSAYGKVVGRATVGGLVGYVQDAKIERCYAVTEVAGNERVGGLLGVLNIGSSVSDCYSVGTVYGTKDFVGGLLGWMRDSEAKNSYSICEVTANVENMGGFAGGYHTDFLIHSCYWDSEINEIDSSEMGIAKLTSQLQSNETFEGWDFETTWQIEEGESFPYLQWQVEAGEYNYPHQ